MSELAARVQTYFWFAVIHFMFATAALIGLVAVPAGLRLLFASNEPLAAGLITAFVGSVALAVGIGFFYVTYFKAPIWAAREERIKARHPGQPWMLNSAWAQRKVVHSNAGAALFLWVWVAGWWGAIIFIWSVNRDKILAAASASYWEAALGQRPMSPPKGNSRVDARGGGCPRRCAWLLLRVRSTDLRAALSLPRLGPIPMSL
jgi:hypothetical protein